MSTLKTNSVEPINNSTNFTIKSGVGSPTRITATTTGDVNVGSPEVPIDSLAVYSTTAHINSNSVLEVTNGNTSIAGGVNLATFMANGDPIGHNPRLIITANNSGIILQETYSTTAHNLMFHIGDVERMRLNSTGLGVLNANPGKALDVTGEIRASSHITTTGGTITATSGGLSAAAGLTVGGRSTLTGAVSLGSSLVVANGTTLGSTSTTGGVLRVLHAGSPTDSLGSSVYVSATTAGTYNALTLQNGDNTANAAEVVLHMPVYNNASGLNIRQSSSAQGPSSWAGSGYDAIIRTGQSGSKLHFAGGSNRGPFLTVAPNGVGIGTVTPGATLDVNGTLNVSGKATSASTVFTDGGTTLVTKDFLYPATGWIFYNSALTGSLISISEFACTSNEGAIFTINGQFRRISASSSINIVFIDGSIGINNTSTGGPTNPRTIARILMTLPDGNDYTYDYPVSSAINNVSIRRIALTASQLTSGFTTVDIGTQSASGQTPPGNAATNTNPASAGNYTLKKISFYIYGNTSAGGTQVNSGTVSAGYVLNNIGGIAQNRVMVIES